MAYSQDGVQRHIEQEDPATWPELDEWFANTLVVMHDLFRPMVRELDPSESVPPDDEGDNDEAIGSDRPGSVT